MRRRWLMVAAVALPPMVLAAVGLSHPARLTLDSAPWWATMHIVLVPLFPLLGVAVWVLLRHDSTVVGWGGRVAAIAYTAFYGGLDAVSGIATGTVVASGSDPGSQAVADLFAAGRPLGTIGAYAFFVAVILVLASAWRGGSRGWVFTAAAVLALLSAYLFTVGHIYWPKGVAAMLGLAVSFAAIEWVNARRLRSDQRDKG
jgi:hypothetical protein